MAHLYFRENGNKNSQTILFLHGGGISSRLWKNELENLTDYHCLAPDLPGHGQSAHIQPFALENSVAALVELVEEQTARGKVSVVGFSVGAIIALGLLAQHPQMVERLFLSGPTPRVGRWATRSFDLLARPLLALLRAEQRTRLVAASLNLTPAQIAYFRADLEQIDLPLVSQINAVVANQPVVNDSSLPALITVGEREMRPVKQRAKRVIAAFPNAQGCIVQGVGHVWSLEAPDLFQQTLRAWMVDAPLPTQLAPMI